MPQSRRSSVGFALSPSKRNNVPIYPPVPDTPKSRRNSIMDQQPIGNDNVFMDVPENNDEKEKKQRQLNRLQQQIQSRNFSSPTSTPSDKRKSLSTVAGLSNQQLVEHYSKCIQLSAENKISVKNAFNLQLIDYMSEMLRRKDSDMNNFQVASCTLDASTKIYAYRVDSVHTDTLKMAGGLGRTQDNKNKDVDDGEEGEGAKDNNRIDGERRRKTRKKALVETNLKNINVAHFDLEYEIDSLFKKTAQQFDEGSSGGGQFLNILQLLDDSCQMMIDAETVVDTTCQTADPNKPKTETVSMAMLPDVSQRLICPTFSPFEFTTWKVGDDDSFCEASKAMRNSESDNEEDNQHRFDIEAIPEPLDDDLHDGFGMDNEMSCDDEGHNDATVLTIGHEGCQKAPPPQMEAVHLKDHLATESLEYSYFDTRVISAWAGPGHWRMKALSKVKSSGEDQGDDVKRRKKQILNLVYENNEEDPEIEKLFAVTRKATKLSHSTFKIWSKDKTTLPMDLHYDGRNFTKLFGRSAIIIRRQKKAAAVDDSVQEYDYDNQNDRDNYCPDVDDGGSNYGDNTVGYDMTEFFSQTVVGSQPEDGDPKVGGEFLDNLVAAPNRVAKINIGYARTAKKIDMKKLKGTMWNLLSEPNTNKENENGSVETTNKSHLERPERMDASYSIDFSKLYKDLPPKLSSKMAENLSVPLAFIALLHLSNEHCLKLVSKGDLKDFTIMQG